MTYAEILCPHCGANGRVENEANSPMLMGRCPMCTGYVLYFCGASLPVEHDVLGSHSLSTIRRHIMERLDGFLEDRVTRFLEAYADELEIEANEPAEECSSPVTPSAEEAQAEPVQPSIRDIPRTAISHEEVQDFLHIDLPLIDRKWYFEKHFGPSE